MKTDPTARVSGAAGMPLSYEAIQSGRNLSAEASANRKTYQTNSNDSISDTLETTDREGDGRQLLSSDQPKDAQEHNAPASNQINGTRLDLTG